MTREEALQHIRGILGEWLALGSRKASEVIGQGSAAYRSIIAKPNGLSLVIDGGCQRDPGISRLATLIEPLRLAGQNDTEDVLVVERLGG